VVLRSRRPLRTRAYDISAEWLDQRHANRLRFDFLSASVDARKRLVKQAVNGGSVPESYMRELHRVADMGSLLEMQTDAGMDHRVVSIVGGKVHAGGEFDHVILATGVTVEPLHNPLYQQVQTEFRAPTMDGLPFVDDVLRWVPNEELFVMGANAMLQLGPGALNLMGAMRGAKIVGRASPPHVDNPRARLPSFKRKHVRCAPRRHRCRRLDEPCSERGRISVFQPSRRVSMRRRQPDSSELLARLLTVSHSSELLAAGGESQRCGAGRQAVPHDAATSAAAARLLTVAVLRPGMLTRLQRPAS
jgi:hypothetical protein